MNRTTMRGLADDESHARRGATQRWMEKVRAIPSGSMRRYEKLSQRNKTIFWCLIALHIVIFALVIIITPHRIGVWFNEFAMYIRGMGAKGVVITAGLVVLSSHPPLFGFSACMTLIGFAYGMWPGALIASIAAMTGAALSFLSVRRFFPGVIRSNAQWDAFGRVMREKGTVLVCMIRWCPMPWAIGNGLFASIESVSFPQFMLSSFLYLPKLLLPVFIGSRLTSLADPDVKHDPLHTWLNIFSIVITITISASAGIWIYKLTLAQMRKLEEGDRAAEALEGLEEGLLAGYRDETGGEEEARSLVRMSPQVTGSDGSGSTVRPDKLQRRSSTGPAPGDRRDRS